MSEIIRPPAVAGTFYAADSKKLHNQLKDFFAKTPSKKPSGKLVGLIAPHAGYYYSGSVAAHAFNMLEKNQFETVFVIGPSHYVGFAGCSIYDLGGYQTPLGVVALERDMIQQLKALDTSIIYKPSAHTREHSIEVELPFLQERLGDFKLIPIVMGEQTPENWQRLARCIAQVAADKDVLLVASSDLSHFYDDKTARRMDTIVAEQVNAFDVAGFWQAIQHGSCEACGAGPIATVMTVAKAFGATQAQVLNYANSGDVSGDHSRVVGYLSAMMWAS